MSTDLFLLAIVSPVPKRVPDTRYWLSEEVSECVYRGTGTKILGGGYLPPNYLIIITLMETKRPEQMKKKLKGLSAGYPAQVQCWEMKRGQLLPKAPRPGIINYTRSSIDLSPVPRSLRFHFYNQSKMLRRGRLSQLPSNEWKRT